MIRPIFAIKSLIGFERKLQNCGFRWLNSCSLSSTRTQEVDIIQAENISKSIVTEVIHQAVEQLNNHVQQATIKRKCASGDWAHFPHWFTIAGENESISKISHRSARSATSGQCGWWTRMTDALASIVQNACFCSKGKDQFDGQRASSSSASAPEFV